MQYLNRASRTPPDVRTKSLNGNDQSLRVNIVTSPRALGFQHQSKYSIKWDRVMKALKGAFGRIYLLKSGKRRSPSVAITAVVLLLTLWLFWSFLLPIRIYGFLPLPTGYPWGNLRRTWVRVRFGYQITADAQRASKLPRYNPSALFTDNNPLEIFVISLPGSKERRASVEQQMKTQKINFRWWNAVDGSQILPEDEVRWYTSGTRLKEFLHSGPGSHSYRKAACDLSHIRIMHDMIASGRDVQVVLEDDVQFTNDNFIATLNTTMSALPADWDVFWLNHGAPIQRNPKNLVGWVGPGIRMFLDNSATVGMVYKRSFALRVLNEAQIGNKDIDNIMNDIGQLGLVRAYVADPPLVKIHEAGFASQIEID